MTEAPSSPVRRTARYLSASYPPALYLVSSFALAVGAFGLFAALDGRRIGWNATIPLMIMVLTVFLDLFAMRALDDFVDYDYDVEYNPNRPLVTGVVSVSDLARLAAGAGVVVLVVNAALGTTLLALVAQGVYVMTLLALHRARRWPPENHVVVLLTGIPFHVLLNLALWLGYRDVVPTARGTSAALGVLVLLMLLIQVEFGRKLVRRPQPGEHSYVAFIGLPATAALTLLPGPVATAMFLYITDPRWPAMLLVTLPQTATVAGAYIFWGRGRDRWPAVCSTLSFLGSLLAFAALGFGLVI